MEESIEDCQVWHQNTTKIKEKSQIGQGVRCTTDKRLGFDSSDRRPLSIARCSPGGLSACTVHSEVQVPLAEIL